MAGSLALASCGPKSSKNLISVTPEFHPLPTPILEPTFTPTPFRPQIATPEVSIKDNQTGAIYRATQNPQGNAGRCVVINRYSDAQKETVFGAATVLGPDANSYNDYPRFIVYRSDITKLGTFTTDEIPPANPFGHVSPGTIVCED